MLLGQGAADPDTDLVYLGSGRYFDPLLGLPLQPNPLGGVPTVPQSLNRYAATSLGAPGVAEGVASNPLAIALWHQVPGTVLGVVIDQAPVTRLAETQLWGLIEMSHLPLNGVSGLISRFTTSRVGQAFTRLPWGIGEQMAAQYAGRSRSLMLEMRLDKGGSLVDELLAGGGMASSRYANARLLNQWEVPVIERGTYGELYFTKSLFRSAGAAGLISVGFQLYDDWGNPYLTGLQKVERSLISGFIGGGTAFMGALIGAGVGTAVTPVVGTAVGAVSGFGLGLWGEWSLAPVIFKYRGDTPTRDLAPLP